MNRRVIVGLIVCLVIGIWARPVCAQSSEPPLRTTVHIVQRGETMFSIAQRYGLTVDAVTHANGIPDPRQIYIGQRLEIPGGEVEVVVEETTPYVVQAGDTLAAIARHYRTTWQILVQTNRLLSPDALYVGQIIQVPVSSTSMGGIGGENYAVHVVRPDDTLFRLALRYGISQWTLAAESRIANPALIYPGQELVVPGEGAGLLPVPFVSVEVQPLPVYQGTTMVVTVHTTEPVALSGRLFGQEVRFGEEDGVYYGLVGVHVFTEPGLYELELSAVDGAGQNTEIAADIIVEAGHFGYERIDISSSSSLLDPTVVAAEQERLDAIRYTFTRERHWADVFQYPCRGPISSYFGAHRAYSTGPYTSYHSGVDFRAPGGTPVHAPAAGSVVLAESLQVRGNVIIIDHGWGVLTGYWHLSSLEAQVGQQVAQGDVVGKVGSTGLSTGAHLHWEVWVGGVSVDGLQWMEAFYPWPERGLIAATVSE
jgi:murein DD-endopeptidase MepM/ murein hydrolase activator NlpD